MDKLLKGIVQFQQKLTTAQRRRYKRLALGQSPDALFFGCGDSRTAVNSFASMNPGDLFVHRHIGNMVPPFNRRNARRVPQSTGASIEYGVHILKVKDIIVCGHAECGATINALNGYSNPKTPCLMTWLEILQPSIKRLKESPHFAPDLPEHNRLSQISVLVQLENLMTYPVVAEQVNAGKLRLHAWWFDLHQWRVLGFIESRNSFRRIDAKYVQMQALKI